VWRQQETENPKAAITNSTNQHTDTSSPNFPSLTPQTVIPDNMKIQSLLLFSLGWLSASLVGATIQIGDMLPENIKLHHGFPPEMVDLAEYAKQNPKMILVGLPGAFTPTWSSVQIPGYKKDQDKLKQDLGIDKVLVYCVNDGAVMEAWAADQGIADEDGTDVGLITFMGDPSGELTEKLGMELTHPGPASVGILGRCKRFALYIEHGVVQHVSISEAPDDPAGDDFPEATCAPSMMEAIQKVQAKRNLEL
jgi:2-Cys peroxiredoxin 5